jgi:hypothetical protein
MDIFLSAESTAPLAYLLSQMNRIVSEEFNLLKSKNYGEELKSIAIITILLPDELYEGGGYPERRLFQLKHCIILTDHRHYSAKHANLPKSQHRFHANNIPAWLEILPQS